MGATLPQLHATLLSISAVGAVVFGGVILARNPRSTAARLHFAYACTIAWWFVCSAMIATSTTSVQTQFWSRLLLLSLGMLPGVSYHLNISLAGLSGPYRKRIQFHWAFSATLTAFAISWPRFLGVPWSYAWGPFPRFTAWGVLMVASIAVVLVEVTAAYRISLARNDPRTAQHLKARAFMKGNMFTAVAMVDFLPTFGIPVYPAGYVIVSIMHSITLYGSVRYRLIEVTPEYAAEHILKEMPDGFLVIDTKGEVQLANHPAAAVLGCEVGDLIGRPLDKERHNPALVDALQVTCAGARTEAVAFVDANGKPSHLRATASTIDDQAGFPVAELWVLHDITDQRAAEAEKERLLESVREAQKLESLGIMASGVAHDFNNLLLAVLGHAELARGKTDNAQAVEAHLLKIEDAAERAAELSGQMLTYTGKGAKHHVSIDLNEVATGMVDLMRPAISKKAALTIQLGQDVPRVIGDPTQLRQVILNLITNASEALGENSGSITVRTGVVRPDESFHSWHQPGHPVLPEEYVFLEVEDTGEGMEEETKRKVFDPFFTTKFAGRGLGLATVVGIVRSHLGLTRVNSTPGRGTIFTVALRAADSATLAQPAGTIPEPWRGSGLALLADDEPEVRSVARSMLMGAGFRVIEVMDGEEAVATFRECSEDIAVVVLDQTMPRMDGRQAFTEIRAMSERVPVVFMSGYSESHGARAVDQRTAFLHKPFRGSTLAEKVREAMEA